MIGAWLFALAFSLLLGAFMLAGVITWPWWFAALPLLFAGLYAIADYLCFRRHQRREGTVL